MKVKKLILVIFLTAFACTTYATEYYQATADLEVRTGAGKGYAVAFTIQRGNEVEVISKKGNWYKIEYAGRSGYVNAKYLEPVSDSNNYTSQQTNESDSFFGLLFIIGVIGVIWILPILIIMASRTVTTSEKLAWILAVIFISWFAWIFYMLLAPLKKKE